MVLKINKEQLLKQVLLGKISPPTLHLDGGLIGAYLTTWDGKPKIGIGVGGIKYNVKVGDSCFGWPETDCLEPGVSLIGLDEQAGGNAYRMKETAQAFVKYSCIGNSVTVVEGEGKGVSGYVTGKGGAGATGKHVYVQFPEDELNKLNIGDKVKIDSIGVGLAIDGFDGRVFNIDPWLLDSLNLKIVEGMLEFPVVKELPSIVMGMGVGGSPPEQGAWCIQSNPPHLVKKHRIEELRIGDLVACRDTLMSYGKGYHRGSVTVGIVTTGASDIAGHGPQVVALAASETGKIKPIIDKQANISHILNKEVPT